MYWGEFRWLDASRVRPRRLEALWTWAALLASAFR